MPLGFPFDMGDMPSTFPTDIPSGSNADTSDEKQSGRPTGGANSWFNNFGNGESTSFPSGMGGQSAVTPQISNTALLCISFGALIV